MSGYWQRVVENIAQKGCTSPVKDPASGPHSYQACGGCGGCLAREALQMRCGDCGEPITHRIYPTPGYVHLEPPLDDPHKVVKV